ncbi:GGDEF domain-containing protein [Butyrivibrio sp. X503]|uniref:GGDEF domain-containing protein n=1 Tax=Butyrivibrio sp. X503 TaxID=2364878 RepID=UPI001314DEED|nr:GGDEF domain-containing protein [Butyrivibrio sp. X503]
MSFMDSFYGGKNVYETSEGYEKLMIFYLCIHLALEVVYIGSSCTPMEIINIGSILLYVGLFFLNKTKHKLYVVWGTMWEILLHAVLGSVFMGYNCGFFFWIFSLVAMSFVPLYIPLYNVFLRSMATVYVVSNCIIFVLLKFFSEHGMLPSRYNASPQVANVMYFINASLSLGTVVGQLIFYSYSVSKYNATLKRMNETDYLTGLYNRKYMIGLFNKEIDRMDSGESGDISIAILDIDFFKKINDTYGHNAGDEILIDLANMFRSEGEGKYMVARWGGEEFAILGSYDLSYEAFCEEMRSLNKKIATTGFIADNNELTVTVSIGTAHYEKGETIVDIIKKADDRLYEAKETGRNKVIS